MNSSIGSPRLAVAHHPTISGRAAASRISDRDRAVSRSNQISAEAVTVIRPMLQATRAQVVAYLDELGQPYRSDSSNQSNEYTRNRIRNNVLPQLEAQVNSESRKHLCQLAQLAREAIDVLDEASADLHNAIQYKTAHELRLACHHLAESSEFLLVHFLKSLWNEQGWHVQEFDAARWVRIARVIVENDPAIGDLPGGIRFVCEDDQICFRLD
ncbi:ATP-binding protein [Planctomycetota bacterium]